MRLTLLFLALTIAAVMIISPPTTKRKRARKGWDGTITVRMEGRNCPLYYPQEVE